MRIPFAVVRRSVSYITTIFQISILGLTCLSSVMLGSAEESALPHLLTIPLAVLTLIFVDRSKAVQLSAPAAGTIGVAVYLVIAYEILSTELDAWIFSGADLLTYLMWLMLLQPKTEQRYWWICALSLLQIAVGAVLSDHGVYGILLVCYLFLGMWTLCVFSFVQARRRFDNADRSDQWAGALSGQSFSAVDQSSRRHFVRGLSSFINQLRIPSTTRNAVRHDPQEQWISSRFVFGTLLSAFVSLLVSLFFVVLIPRVWIGNRLIVPDRGGSAARKMTGFTEEVQLGEIGEILESRDRVLQIRVVDEATNNEIDIVAYAAAMGYDEPLFRGTVLNTYENGRWHAMRAQRRSLSSDVERLRGRRNIVRQEIVLEPIGSDVIFAIRPILGCRPVHLTEPIRVNFPSLVLSRPDGVSSERPFEYLVYSPNALATGPVDYPGRF